MIFVTVGTHEQQFNRLVQRVDELKGSGGIDGEVVIQTGFSTYEPEHCRWQKLFPYPEMEKLVSRADIVITHGGPSSFIMPLQVGKIPIVVPRMKRYDEHVNDHQVEFCRKVAERQRNIIVVEDVSELGAVIRNYRELAARLPGGLDGNNARFCAELEKIVEGLFKK